MALVSFLLLPLCVSATLLRKGLRTVKGTSELARDSCACLSWQEVYMMGSAKCGDAFEFPTISQWKHAVNGHLLDVNANFPSTAAEWMTSYDKAQGSDVLDSEYCDGMFLKMHGNTCVKVASDNDATQWYGKSWCYVSSECQNLNGGVRVENKVVSAKFCIEGEDEMLSEKSPEQLMKWVNDQRLAPKLALVVKMGYPYMGEGFSELMTLQYGNKTALSTEQIGPLGARFATLQEVIAKGKPVVYDYGDHASTKYVVYGQQLWKFNYPATCIYGCKVEDGPIYWHN